MPEASTDSPVAQIVRLDQGSVNARILARESKADFRRVEAASIKIATRFYSAEGKRIFVRMFSTLQLNTYFISVIARARIEHEDIETIEIALRERIDTASRALDRAIDDAEALFTAHGISAAATYDAQPLEVQVGVLSSTGRRYLELITKLDQLMPLLQTLEIHEVITTRVLDGQRAQLKRQVRDVANAARNLAVGLRRRMKGPASPIREMSRPSPGNGADADQIIHELGEIPQPSVQDAVPAEDATAALEAIQLPATIGAH